MSEMSAEEKNVQDSSVTFRDVMHKLLVMGLEARESMPNHRINSMDSDADRFLKRVKQAIEDRLADGRIVADSQGIHAAELCDVLDEAKWWKSWETIPDYEILKRRVFGQE